MNRRGNTRKVQLQSASESATGVATVRQRNAALDVDSDLALQHAGYSIAFPPRMRQGEIRMQLPAFKWDLDYMAKVAFRVLLADDDYPSRILASATLEMIGCSVTCAADGQEAVDAVLREEPFDVIFMDFHMPHLDGLQATREIRKREQAAHLPRVPIVALTASAMPSEREQCIGAGMDDIVLKPVSIPELQQVASKWARAHRHS